MVAAGGGAAAGEGRKPAISIHIPKMARTTAAPSAAGTAIRRCRWHEASGGPETPFGVASAGGLADGGGDGRTGNTIM